MNIKNYLLSVTALIILSEITRIVLPNGRTKRTVETVYALVMIITLFSPLAKLFSYPSFDGIKIDEKVFIADSGYYDYVDSIGVSKAKKDVENYLIGINFPFSSVGIETERFSIKKVVIYCDKNASKEIIEHINSSEVRNELSSLLNVDAEVLIVEKDTD